MTAASWSTAVPDWEDRIREGRSLLPDLPLFEDYAEKALRIFKRLKVPDLIGTPTFGAVCEQWVFDFVRALFGTYDPEKKRRMIQEYFLMVPKKNSKSAIAAAIMMVAMILNERPLAEMLLISETQHIASITFATAAGIIRADEALDEKQRGVFKVAEHNKTITHLVTGATLKILSADNDVITGSKAAAVLVDEAHVLGMKAKAPAVYLELRGGLASRPEGFFLQITTQSKSEPAGQFKRELQKAREVRDGVRQSNLLSVIYEFPKEIASTDAWRDPATWGLVNPNLERSVSLDFLLEQFENALVDGLDALTLFASQHLNVEIGMGLHTDRWIGAEYWQAAAQPGGLTLDEVIARSEVCVVGIDGGGLDDLLGFAVLGRDRDTKDWLHWGRAWADPEVSQRRKGIVPRLMDFAQDGDLVWTRTGSEDMTEVAEICARLNAAGLLPEKQAIGLDPEGVAEIIDALIGAGIADGQLAAVSQGWKLNSAIQGTPRKLKNGTLKHGGSRMMAWAVGNAKTERRGNAVVVTKAVSGAGKIDPLMALFNAVQLMSWNPVAAGSVDHMAMIG